MLLDAVFALACAIRRGLTPGRVWGVADRGGRGRQAQTRGRASASTVRRWMRERGYRRQPHRRQRDTAGAEQARLRFEQCEVPATTLPSRSVVSGRNDLMEDGPITRARERKVRRPRKS